MVMADFSQAGEGAGKVYPTGSYRVLCREVSECKAKTGLLQLKWAGVIKGGEYDGQPIKTYTPIEDKLGGDSAIWRSLNMMHAFGIETETLPAVDSESSAFRKVYKSCEGKQSVWYLTEDSWNGKPKNNVEAQRDPDQEVQEIQVGTADSGADCPFNG